MNHCDATHSPKESMRALGPVSAVAKVSGPESALALVDALAASGDLDSYHLLHATRADLLRRIGSAAAAARSYERALELATNESERRFLGGGCARFKHRKRDRPGWAVSL